MSERPRSDARGAGQYAPAAVRRFYKTANVREAEGGGFALMLDGRAARTPGRNRLAAASRPLMRARRRGMGAAGRDDRSGRHAADAAPQFRDRRRRADDGRDAGGDRRLRRLGPPLLPRGEPEALAERQRLAFDPVLDWAAEGLGAPVQPAGGRRAGRPAGRGARRGRRGARGVDDPAALAALAVMTT